MLLNFQISTNCGWSVTEDLQRKAYDLSRHDMLVHPHLSFNQNRLKEMMQGGHLVQHITRQRHQRTE